MNKPEKKGSSGSGQRTPDEHYPCPNKPCAEYPWHAAFDVFVETLQEEAASVRALVNDDGSSCPARDLRRERLAALEWAVALGDQLRRWEW